MATAITYSRFGGPEVLEVSEVEPPQPGSGRVRIVVYAAGINPYDLKARRGELAGARPAKFPVTPGVDAAGVVDAVGEGGVDGVQVGDEVFGVARGGSYAEFALMAAPVPKPAGVSWEVAAALPTPGEAAYRALNPLGLSAGETLLIHGAAGSVGMIATQVAVQRGVRVIGSAREADLEFVRSLGAVGVRYGEELVEQVRASAPQGVDAVLDTSGAGVLRESVELAGDPERVVTIADPAAAEYGVHFAASGSGERAWEALPELAALAAEGKLQVPIGRTYPLTEASAAHADIEARRSRGKVVLLVH
jgi:NADPH:quinone reductase-like Zn-dependent oxidoreductase